MTHAHPDWLANGWRDADARLRCFAPLAELDTETLHTVTCGVMTVAWYLARGGAPRPFSPPATTLALGGAEGVDLPGLGCLYQLLPRLLGLGAGPRLLAIGPECKLAGAPPEDCAVELLPTTLARGLTPEHLSRLHTLVLFHPGLSETPATWLGDSGLLAALRLGVPTLVTSYSKDEALLERAWLSLAPTYLDSASESARAVYPAPSSWLEPNPFAVALSPQQPQRGALHGWLWELGARPEPPRPIASPEALSALTDQVGEAVSAGWDNWLSRAVSASEPAFVAPGVRLHAQNLLVEPARLPWPVCATGGRVTSDSTTLFDLPPGLGPPPSAPTPIEAGLWATRALAWLRDGTLPTRPATTGQR